MTTENNGLFFSPAQTSRSPIAPALRHALFHTGTKISTAPH